MHDLRAPNSTSAVFRDPVDTFSPIYSLLPIGTERFVAGGARHSIIKVFDLRMPGGKLYHAADVNPCSPEKHKYLRQPKQKSLFECCNYHHEAKHKRCDWNVFLNMPFRRSRRDSPVYTLSRPSNCSPSFFAGIESHIVQLDIVSVLDQHPDSVFQNVPTKRNNRGDVRHKWDLQEEAISLPMYEHVTGPVKLLKQQPRLEYSERSIRQGWDERWSS